MVFIQNILNIAVLAFLFNSIPIETTGATITTICQDETGTMWFGGQNGITRYDGCRYMTFHQGGKDNGGLPDINIQKIFRDDCGKVWICHLSGLSLYDEKQGKFVNIQSPEGVITDITSLSENQLLVLAGGHLWIFDSDRKIFSKELLPRNLADMPAWSFYKKGSNLMIGCTDGRIVVMNNGPASSKIIETGIPAPINCMVEDNNGVTWIGSEGKGLWKIKVQEGSKAVKAGTDSRSEYVRTIRIDNSGNIWIGTKNGLYICRDGIFTQYRHNYYDNRSISHDSILDMFIDAQGTVWMGTYYGGVCYCTPHSSQFSGILSDPTDKFFTGNIISDIVEDSDKSLWIGSNSSGLNHFYPSGKIEHINGEASNSSEAMDIKCIHICSSTGNIFVGGEHVMTYILAKNHKIMPLKEGIQDAYAFDESPEGGILIGTTYGLFEYREKTGNTNKVYIKEDVSKIKSLKMDSKGVLWIGKKIGVTALEWHSGRIIDLPDELNDIRYVEDFHEDSSGAIWICSNNGLLRYNRDSCKVQLYTKKDGMPDNIVHGIEEDRSGMMWISTNNGLCRINPETNEKRIYTMADGLPGNRFTSYAHCYTSRGEMYFGGLFGLIHFNPDTILPPYDAVAPVISGVESNGCVKKIEDGSVVLDADERDISFIFSAPDFISGENGHFHYIMDGVDNEWHEAGADRMAEYRKLEHGNYTFRLRYTNSSGIQHPQEAVLHISISPHWYETLSARIIAILLIISLVIMVFIRELSKKEKIHRNEIEKVRKELMEEFSLEFVKLSSKTPTKTGVQSRNLGKDDEDFMRRAMQVIRENLENVDFTIDDFAKSLYMSKSNLQVRIKATYGVSPLEFIKTVRFNEACRLLQGKKHTISEIADMVGFATPSYFASAFHNFMGCTPSEYISQNTKTY